MLTKILTTTTLLAALLATPVASQTRSGRIEGSLSFPSNYIPALKVCAKNIRNNSLSCIQTKQNQKQYKIEVQPGTYHVYATVTIAGQKDTAYYSRAVTCGLRYGCNDHRPIAVTVRAGQVAKGINPQDWYDK
ncbi:MAG TPA: hypothetical protein DCP31_28460 [Cyanobacteria bacterium UBA8543]|nr:hypothetical protein [Cyanobacteria bacterium UBA8543]